MTPPGRCAASTSSVSTRAFCRWYAAARPEMPAPMTMAWTFLGMRTRLRRLERLGKDRQRGLLLPFEVRIKNHGEITDKNAAEPGGANFFIVERDQAVGLRVFQLLQFGLEILVEIDGKFIRDFGFHHHSVAEQSADHFAANDIVLQKAITAHGGDTALLHGLFPGRQVAEILRVSILDAADGGDTHTVEIGSGLGGVTLKIAVQRAVALRNSQFVIGFREMAHADVQIAGFEKCQQAIAKNI